MHPHCIFVTLSGKGKQTMGRPDKPWPPKALGVLEASVDRLREIERELDEAEAALLAGDNLAAMKRLSDSRVKALKVVAGLVQSRIGKYEQEQAPQWNPPAAVEKKTVQEVTQVLSLRRS
jgi:hypothetical protein